MRLIVLAACAALAAAQPPVSTHMSLDEVEAALAAYPPRWEFGEQRAAIMASLDRLIVTKVGASLDDDGRARLRPLHAFYLRRVDRALDRLEKARVVEGVHAFKFYSSSYIFKSAAGVLAMDFCQGPINNGGEPETRDEYRSGFYLTPAQRDRLARIVDVMIVTHRHHDHADYSLARRLIAQGKKVIGPEQLQRTWKDLAKGVTVPAYGRAQSFAPVEIFTMLGSQYGTNRPTGNGAERIGVPHPTDPERDSETVVYLFRIGGLTFLTGGENQVPAGEWLREGVARGFRPDVRLSLGQYQGERSLIEALRPMEPLFRLPLHEYEMTHGGGGNRTGPLLVGSGRAAFDRRESMPLLWGEDFVLTRSMLPARR